ncbi:unnamed protein product [Dovyalis caffra]|uniref:Core Histone H2A/H2B/H3 domain-containing protein n=1 Tax=Dovyalis caffra TaxID=77055 RepID=A0AAV1RAT9_9ROSI|nr:unnamed protein product [Dovyalis caffra]
MAPKRRGKKVVGTVMRSTRKVLRETVQVAFIERDTQESTQYQEQDGETEDIDTPAMKTFRTIPVAQKEHEEEDQITAFSVEKQDKEVATLDSQEREEPSKEGERKEEQTSDVSEEVHLKEVPNKDDATDAVPQDQEEEPSREEENRKEDQRSRVSQEEPSEEEPKKDTSSAGDQEGKSTKKVRNKEGKKTAQRKDQTQEGKGDIERKRKRKRGTTESGPGYKRYVVKVLKQVHPDLGISSMAMSVVNSLMNDMFERIAEEAAKLSNYRKRTTLSSGEVQGAVKLVLPRELGKHAIAEGSKAVANYMSYGIKRSKS